MSEIPPENIEIAKGQGSFPCDISVLAVNSDMEWSAPRESLNSWPLNIFEDGHVIFYR
jgi:ubiquitin carboxyl-terminal hydrolase 47